MALDDRERNFEKALERQLRANADAGLDCPDAETLAAYHERMLSPEEMASLKSHIAACPSCQEVLSTLEVTEAIPVGEEDSQKVFAQKTRVMLSAVHAAPVFSNPVGIAGPVAGGSAVREMPKPYMKWIVPAGAIAAGLLIWVAMNESWKTQKAMNQADIHIAENRESKEPAPGTPSPDLRMSVPAAKPAERTYQAENERAKQSTELVEADKETRSLGRTRTNSTNAPSRGPAMMQNQVQNQIQNNGNLNQSQDAYAFREQSGQQMPAPKLNAPAPALKSQVVPAAPPPPAQGAAVGNGEGDGVGQERKDQKIGAVSETVEVTASEPAVGDIKGAATDATANLSVSGRSVQQMQKLESGVAMDSATTARKEKQAAQAGRAQLKKADAAPVAGGMTSAALRDADEFRLSVVRTKDTKIFWVISQEGEVFRSEDAGKSSRKQEIGAGIKAIAGSATDAKTCWILAEKGIVVRTADGGQHWATANVPAGLPFMTITALDATHAIVSDASGKISYTTSDGGATWNVMQKPQ